MLNDDVEAARARHRDKVRSYAHSCCNHVTVIVLLKLRVDAKLAVLVLAPDKHFSVLKYYIVRFKYGG